MSRVLTLSTLLGLAAACAPADATRPRFVGHRLTYIVPVAKDDPLLSYAWDGGNHVPAFTRLSEERIDFGELGLDDRTRLYLTFNEGTGRFRDGTRPERELRTQGVGWTQGRFGSAARFDSVNDRLELGAASLLERPGALSFWLRPDTGEDGGDLIRAGFLTLELTEDYHVALQVKTEPLVHMQSAPLVPGEWNHVAVAIDGPELAQVRLVVNDTTRSKGFETLALATPDAPIVMGGFVGDVDDLHVSAVPTSTAELLERSTRGARPGEHELALRYADGDRTVRLWAGTITKAALETAEDWRGGRLRHLVHDGEKLRRVPGHWERIPAAHPPLARTTHPTVFLEDGKVFLFGGETRDTHGWVWSNTNDTWIFHTQEGRWEQILTADAPPPTCHQPAAFSPDHNMILYAGGWRNDTTPPVTYQDTWGFFMEDYRWVRLEPGGVKMPPTSNAGLVYHPGKRRFFLFAGPRIFVYNPVKNHWRRVPKFEAVDEAGEPVEYRPMGSPMVGYDPRNESIVLFGGGSGNPENPYYSDVTAVYDVEANRFTVLDLERRPAGRLRAGFAYDPARQHYAMFGGVHDQQSQRFSDLWIYDPKVPEWRPVEASNPPSERGGYYGMAFDPALDRYFLLCGRQAKDRFLNEAWSLHLDESAPGEATYVYDLEAFPQRTWFADTDAPGDSTVAFRFRTSTDLVEWSPWNATLTGADTSRYVQVELTLTPGTDGSEPSVTAMGWR